MIEAPIGERTGMDDLKQRMEPIVDFLTWAKGQGFVLGTWDGDGQMSEVDSKELTFRYAMRTARND